MARNKKTTGDLIAPNTFYTHRFESDGEWFFYIKLSVTFDEAKENAQSFIEDGYDVEIVEVYIVEVGSKLSEDIVKVIPLE